MKSLMMLWETILLCCLWQSDFSHGNEVDWLVQKIETPTVLTATNDNHLQLTNGLITREFTFDPDFATIDYYSHEKESSLLRAINPEARVKLDDIVYDVGGFKTSIPRAYLNRTALSRDMKLNPNAFHYVSHQIKKPEAPYPYTPKRGAPKDIVWPPKGLRLDVVFKAPAQAAASHKLVNVTVHYEMFDGIPLMYKWVSINSEPAVWGKVMVSILSVEYLAVNYQWAQVGYGWMFAQSTNVHGIIIDWITDPESDKMPGSYEQVLHCYYLPMPYAQLDEEGFVSFAVQQLLVGSSDPERLGLAKRRMLRLLAPQTQENPIFAQLQSSDLKKGKYMIDQMAEVGFELMFYVSHNWHVLESDDNKTIAQLRENVAYAKSKGIEVGAYDLLSTSRKTLSKWMAVGKYAYPMACMASGWYDFLMERIPNFMEKTGMTAVIFDGCYSGYTCSSEKHSHHIGYNDSVYRQEQLVEKIVTALQKRGYVLNLAQYYYYQGGTTTAIGYNEHQFALPHWQDLSISRQTVFDDTFHFTPTAGWIFLPLVDYHSGGAFEPLSKNKQAYNWALAQYFGAGVAATFRGHELYDSPGTKAIVKKWVSFFKKYRDILTSDIIHVRRADMQSIDCFMHVNPLLDIKALAMAFNPTNETKSMNLTLPLYYSGITTVADVSQEGASSKQYTLSRSYKIIVPVEMDAMGITWFLITGK